MQAEHLHSWRVTSVSVQYRQERVVFSCLWLPDGYGNLASRVSAGLGKVDGPSWALTNPPVAFGNIMCCHLLIHAHSCSEEKELWDLEHSVFRPTQFSLFVWWWNSGALRRPSRDSRGLYTYIIHWHGAKTICHSYTDGQVHLSEHVVCLFFQPN